MAAHQLHLSLENGTVPPLTVQPGPIHAVVPLKDLSRAKSRLADLLTIDERHDLVLDMLCNTVTTLVSFIPDNQHVMADGLQGEAESQQVAPSIAVVWVISADPSVLALAGELGAQPVVDTTQDLNAALEWVKGLATAAGASALLVVPADVPLVSPSDLRALIVGLADRATMVIAPDATEHGTNALAVTLPSPLSFQFGSDSFTRHLTLAQELGLIIQIYRSPTLALDIDTPEDLYQLGVRGVQG